MTEKILSDILSRVEDSNSSIRELDKKFELHKQRIEFDIDRINELDARQNDLIDEHIQGVNTLKEMHVAHREESLKMIHRLKESCDMQMAATDTRLRELEKPSPWMIWLGQNKIIAGGLIATAAALATILKFWEYLTRLGE